MPYAETFHNGRLGTATINGTEPAVVGWSINPTAVISEFRNSKSKRFPRREASFCDLSGTIDFDFDFNANAFGTPLTLTPGANLLNVKLYLHLTSGIYHNIPSAYVTGVPQTLTVEGKIVTRVNFVTDGTYDLAGGNTPGGTDP